MTQFNPSTELQQLEGDFIALKSRIAEIERQIEVDLVSVIELMEPARLSGEDYATARRVLCEYRGLPRAVEDMRSVEVRMLYWIERSAMYADNPAMAAMIEVAKSVPAVRRRVIETAIQNRRTE